LPHTAIGERRAAGPDSIFPLPGDRDEIGNVLVDIVNVAEPAADSPLHGRAAQRVGRGHEICAADSEMVQHCETGFHANERRDVENKALVKMAVRTEIFSIDMDTLPIDQDGIPDSARSGIFKPEHGEVELAIANPMHQFDA
jgi:hypothetical protein